MWQNTELNDKRWRSNFKLSRSPDHIQCNLITSYNFATGSEYCSYIVHLLRLILRIVPISSCHHNCFNHHTQYTHSPTHQQTSSTSRRRRRPHTSKTIHQSPIFQITPTLLQHTLILFGNDTLCICLDNVWTDGLHFGVGWRKLIWLPCCWWWVVIVITVALTRW